jgi:hypothetical protein
MGSVIERAATAAEGYSFGFTICGVVTMAGGLIGVLFLRPETERARLARRTGAQPQAIRTV